MAGIVKICLTCKKEFRSIKDCKSRKQLYCSRKCYGKNIIGHKNTEKQLKALTAGRKISHSNGGRSWSEKEKLEFSQKKKGIPLSSDHCKALSRAKKGKAIKHFVENRKEILEKISKSLLGKPQFNRRGKNHHNWQGGKTALNFQIRSLLVYKNWRRKVLKRDNYTCQKCGVKSGCGHKVYLHTDHKKKFSQILYENNIKTIKDALKCKELWETDNGRVLCRECHLKTDSWGGGLFYNGKIKMAHRAA